MHQAQFIWAINSSLASLETLVYLNLCHIHAVLILFEVCSYTLLYCASLEASIKLHLLRETVWDTPLFVMFSNVLVEVSNGCCLCETELYKHASVNELSA